MKVFRDEKGDSRDEKDPNFTTMKNRKTCKYLTISLLCEYYHQYRATGINKKLQQFFKFLDIILGYRYRKINLVKKQRISL